jgi:outer membrane lipoprotein carrier protein
LIKTMRISVLLAALLLASVARAGAGLDQLNAFLDGMTSLQADFSQTVLNSENASTGAFSGSLMVKRPGRFRWNYREPYRQDIIGDGRWVWLVDYDLEQISQQSQDKALRGTPALLLIDGGDIREQFELVELGLHQGMQWIELIPRDPEAPFERIQLAFADNQLQRMETRDRFGQISRMVFQNLKRNAPLDDELFRFTNAQRWDLFTQ